MAYFRTCRSCKHATSGCVYKEVMRKNIKGLGITSIKFSCKHRSPLFREGQRVRLSWRVFSGDHYIENESIHDFYATVISEVEEGLRYIVRVDPGLSIDEDCDASAAFLNKDLIIKARPKSMRPVDQPDVVFCRSCLAFIGEVGARCQGYGDQKSLYSYWPKDCLKNAMEAAE